MAKIAFTSLVLDLKDAAMECLTGHKQAANNDMRPLAREQSLELCARDRVFAELARVCILS